MIPGILLVKCCIDHRPLAVKPFATSGVTQAFLVLCQGLTILGSDAKKSQQPTFSWFASLPHNSIEGWEDLETKFHHYFDSGVMEKGIIDLFDVRQMNNESTLHYLLRFKEVRNQWYTLTLSEVELVSIAI